MNHRRVYNRNLPDNRYESILYIITSAFRAHDNHALERALELVHDTSKELIIALYREPEEQERNNLFFDEGISNMNDVLGPITDKVYYFQSFTDELHQLIVSSHYVVTDMAYLKEELIVEETIRSLCESFGIGMDSVETNVFVPVQEASDKEEYAASTIRKKILSKMEDFNDPVSTTLEWFNGEAEALEVLVDFIENKLDRYIERNDPSLDVSSGLSRYLKYGFISPLTIYNEVAFFTGESTDSFIEELIIRRELAYNFVYYNTQYDVFEGMTYPWAYDTMNRHLMDEREYLYSIDDYISFNTHDQYFNAAMKEMVYLGTMHGYMRMYWAKKIIEWSPTYRIAYDIIKYLNNYYFYDGNTPNGYTGISWCFGKHDRAWKERPIFGKMRYMNANGLRRKFNIDEYVRLVEKKVSEWGNL